MIGKVTGTASEKHGPLLYVDTTSGLTYQIYVGQRFGDKVGAEVSFYTHLDVKEDSLQLYGFASFKEYGLFGMLISVDGVGPKTAYTILQSSTEEDIKQAIILKDVNFFLRVKGIGKKTAQKILIELTSVLGVSLELSETEESQDDMDLIDALQALGYKKDQAQKVRMEIDSSLSLEEKIKVALKKLSVKK